MNSAFIHDAVHGPIDALLYRTDTLVRPELCVLKVACLVQGQCMEAAPAAAELQVDETAAPMMTVRPVSTSCCSHVHWNAAATWYQCRVYPSVDLLSAGFYEDRVCMTPPSKTDRAKRNSNS